MSTHGDGGKGSGRRVENSQAVRDNWDKIFGAKAQVSSPLAAGLTEKETMMNDEYEDETHEDYEDDDGRMCPVCRGDMVVTATGMYLFCDTCGHREELVDDDYL